jgi:aspartyl-tRNA(Asn)/glutamyl-tRNA(Gln) amidotransferase subunit A
MSEPRSTAGTLLSPPVHPCLASGSIRDTALALSSGSLSPADLAHHVLSRVRSLESSHAYIHFDPVTSTHSLQDLFRLAPRTPLHAIPVSIKDLMDVAGLPTTCGAAPALHPAQPATVDAAWLLHWRKAGAWLAGKTHLNEHAYGITGENPWFGDCTRPGDPSSLTGGSSSGAAASVAGGSAFIGLGTDTGGSLRVPAALCGLTSFRAPGWFPNHAGVAPLAPSFDALGWINRHLADVGFIARALPSLPSPPQSLPARPTLIWIDGPILAHCEPAVLANYHALQRILADARWPIRVLNPKSWDEATPVFAGIQAAEAAEIHRTNLGRHPEAFSPPVRQRLEWGAGLSPDDISRLRSDRVRFLYRTLEWLEPGCVVVLPACPVNRLAVGADQTANRPRILALTTPASLCNLPVLTLPFAQSEDSSTSGFQFIGWPGSEWHLIGLSTALTPVLKEVGQGSR